MISVSLGLLLVLGAIEAPMMHEHDSREHVHPEHHHAAAAHVHSHHDDRPASRHSVPQARWIDACDPGDHVARVSVFNVTLTEHALPIADRAPAWQLAFDSETSLRPDVLEVRVHGPPARYQLPPRAPPSA